MGDHLSAAQRLNVMVNKFDKTLVKSIPESRNLYLVFWDERKGVGRPWTQMRHQTRVCEIVIVNYNGRRDLG
jgi:hypothetical protein